MAYTKKMLQEAQERGAIDEARRPLFERFLLAVGRQIRPPYHRRHPAEQTARLLEQMFEWFWERQDGRIFIRAEMQGRLMVLTTILADQPFIVDTVRMLLQAKGATNISGFNVVIPVGRGEDGRPARIDDSADRMESLMHLEVEGIDPGRLDEIVDYLRSSLRLGKMMVRDFHAMTEVIEVATLRFSRVADRHPDQGDRYREAGEFLRWLLADNFVFMAVVFGEQRYGFAREEVADLWPIDQLLKWPPGEPGQPLRVRKGHRESPVHRAGRVDEIRVEFPGADGDGEGSTQVLLIQGLFTYRALTQPSRHVPLLRRVLGNILRTDGSQPGSYRYKGVANAFDSLPTEFLFTASSEEIVRIINHVLEAEAEQDVRAYINQREDTTFMLAAMPRIRWSERLSSQIEDVLVQATGASYRDHGVFIGRYNTMLAHFYLTGTRMLGEQEVEEVRARILDLATPWEMRMYEALEGVYGAEKADALTLKYSSAFDEVYRQNRPITESVRDLEALERLEAGGGDVLVEIFTERRSRLYLRVYQRRSILLSHMLPVLDDFGLVIIDQFADPVTLPDGQQRYIDTFRLQPIAGLTPAEVLARGRKLAEGIEAVFDQRMPSDPLNRLLLQADLPWEAVDMLRAYHGYARQLGFYYTLDRVQTILASRPELVQMLWAAFRARFDVAVSGSRAPAISRADETLSDALRKVQDHDQDVVFRTFLNLVQSTVRTNFYRQDRKFHYLSFKIECARVQNMPSPRMMYEIYVHHRDMEGLHLRGGKIARGGIRWSDRSDFRREILDLVSTQMVKNVLIVPEGAKGGFRMKQRVQDPAERRKQADNLYKVLIRGMLDVTDNIVGGKTVHPPRVVTHDGDDPYLVVAADKGTAHLSDTANGISAEYSFWLGDAFASGGSNGYDHKKVGITARGGWKLVRRHFKELGVDPYKETFTAVGVGDPAGDVFGNGVIETPRMKLLGAFNHAHVFLDPDPDPEVSYQERLRMFREVKGWDHYNPALLSKGGGVYSRAAKSIPLSPQVQKMLGVLQDELPSEVVIRLLLRLNVDLLWNGGIGTYVKASTEDHIAAGDPSNDQLRVNGNELRARIVGEGGNLGFTQSGRIEYALGGGRINTDAIDNSGGVDMSDHEVNLKILLNPMVAAEQLSLPDRNALLERMTEEVAQAVLHNSDVHGRQISLDAVRSARDPMSFSRTIEWACSRSNVSRADLRLPDAAELGRRAAQGRGLTRPELAILAAHVKMHVFNELSRSETSEIPDFEGRVLGYFPEEIRRSYRDQVLGHMLYKSIGMTVVVNQVMGEAGGWFFPGLMELTGAPAATVARAWFHAMALIDAGSLLEGLAGSNISLNDQYRAWVGVTDAVWGLMALWLSPGEGIPDPAYQSRIRDVLELLPSIPGSPHQDRLREREASFSDLPAELSRQLAVLGELSTAYEIAAIQDSGEKPDETIVRYLAIGEASRLLPTIRGLESRRAEGGWDPVAIAILRNRYLVQLRSLVQVIRLGPEAKLGVERVVQRLSRNHLAELSAEMETILADASLAALLVAEERVRARIQRDFVSRGLVVGTGGHS